MLAQTAPAFTKPKYESDSSATRVDTALLVSMLFLQRFTLPFGATFLHLDFVGIVVILLYQFLNGKVVIQYDRLLWFLAFAFANTCCFLLNFKSAALTSYSGSIVFYSFFMLSRASTPDQYRRTLQAFQFLVMLIACLAIVQFPAQFVLDSHKLIRFYGIVPDILLGGERPYEGIQYKCFTWRGPCQEQRHLFKRTVNPVASHSAWHTY